MGMLNLSRVFFASRAANSALAEIFLPDCNSQIGLVSPVPACDIQNVTNICQDGGYPEELSVDGVARLYCVYGDVGSEKLPLILWLHGGGYQDIGSGSAPISHTGLVAKASQFSFGGGGPVGFMVITPQARILDWPRSADEGCNGHWDIYHRNLASPSSNPDIALMDALIDKYVSAGRADPAKVFMMGWSNGGFFSQMYAVARFTVGTPGTQTMVAAASVYSAGDPFNDINDATDNCRLQPYPQSRVPIMLTSRSCDLVCCGSRQYNCSNTSPGFQVEEWVVDAQRLMGDSLRMDKIDGDGQLVSECESSPLRCGIIRAFTNHIKWPENREQEMLDFLASAIDQQLVV